MMSSTYHRLHEQDKSITNAVVSMKLYNEKKPKHLEIDASGVGLGAGQLQVKYRIQLQKCDTSQHSSMTSNIHKQKSHCHRKQVYYMDFERGFRFITWIRQVLPLLLFQWGQHYNRSQPLVAILKKDMGTLSHRLERIPLCIYQLKIRILYNPGPKLLTVDWLSRHN